MKLIAFLITLITMNAIAAPPKPVESEYLLSTGGGFLITRGQGIFYAMNFSIIKDLPVGYKLSFSFENPRKRSPAIVETQKLEIDGTEILVQSPYLDCIRNRKKYEVIVEIYNNESESVKLGSHAQKVEFHMPNNILEQFGIETC